MQTLLAHSFYFYLMALLLGLFCPGLSNAFTNHIDKICMLLYFFSYLMVDIDKMKGQSSQVFSVMIWLSVFLMAYPMIVFFLLESVTFLHPSIHYFACAFLLFRCCPNGLSNLNFIPNLKGCYELTLILLIASTVGLVITGPLLMTILNQGSSNINIITQALTSIQLIFIPLFMAVPLRIYHPKPLSMTWIKVSSHLCSFLLLLSVGRGSASLIAAEPMETLIFIGLSLPVFASLLGLGRLFFPKSSESITSSISALNANTGLAVYLSTQLFPHDQHIALALTLFSLMVMCLMLLIQRVQHKLSMIPTYKASSV